MNYYYDTEFIEGTQKTFFGESKPTIDLISIGIVCEDGREYYAISKDFNLKEAWNRYDIKTEQVSGDMRNRYPEGIKTKVYWIRENVLLPIVQEFCSCEDGFDYKTTKRIFNDYGKSNKQIAEEIKDFVSHKELLNTKVDIEFGCTRELRSSFEGRMKCVEHNWGKPKFYGYYSDYDHVALCWLYGKMLNLPSGFPMYTIDLKQESDRIYYLKKKAYKDGGGKNFINKMSNHLDYPKQVNEHNALEDARWNKQLHEFLLKL